MTSTLAAMPAAGERFAAHSIALPPFVGAIALLLGAAALATLLAATFARSARAAIVTRPAAFVNAARQHRLAAALAAPRSLRTAYGAQSGLLAQTRTGDHLRTRRTRTRMAEQHATMPAIGLQAFLAQFAARVRYQPRMAGRIDLFAAEALVVARNVRVGIVFATFRAIPFDANLFGRHENALIGVVIDLGGLLDALL